MQNLNLTSWNACNSISHVYFHYGLFYYKAYRKNKKKKKKKKKKKTLGQNIFEKSPKANLLIKFHWTIFIRPSDIIFKSV